MMGATYDCPQCGRELLESFGTEPCTGVDEHTFQCDGLDCMGCFEADEIIEPAK